MTKGARALYVPLMFWPPHEEQFLDRMAASRWWECSAAFSEELSSSLLECALHTDALGRMTPASVGKGIFKTREARIRGDSIQWFDDFTSPQGKVVEDLFSGLIILSRRHLQLPAKRFECHFAKYEPGQFYVRHRDRHKRRPGRLLTCVIYLNTLSENEGGELVLYDLQEEPRVIRPEQGKVIIFDSELEHEVRPTDKTRWTLTGWIRSDLLPGLRL